MLLRFGAVFESMGLFTIGLYLVLIGIFQVLRPGNLVVMPSYSVFSEERGLRTTLKKSYCAV